MTAALNGTRRALRLGTGLATCVSCIVFAQSALGQSLPELANAGGAAVSTAGNVMTVDALAADKVLNWGTFSVASGNTVQFVSTDGSGGAVATPVTVINRVIGKDVGGTNTFFPSIIDGSLTSTSNISLWLVNPSGIVFGAAGSFNGGSLVLSTLDFPDLTTGRQVFGAGDRTNALASRSVVIDPATALTAVELRLDAGLGAITADGSVLLLGEQVTVGKSVLSEGSVFVVTASDVRITTQAGSPIGYSFAAGTRLGGARVLASGNVQGRSIVVAASNGTSALADLLQVDVGGQLTATADGGSVTLLTAAHPISPATAAGANIVSQGIVRTTGLDADVSVTSNASALVERISATGDVLVRSGAGASDTVTAGTVSAGGNLELRSTGDMTLGTTGSQSILAGGTLSLRAGGAIARGAGSTALAIRSHGDTGLLNGDLLVDAGDVDLGNASLAGGSAGTAAVSIFSDAAISLGSARASKFAATAVTTFDATGSIVADNTAIAGPDRAISISAAGGISLGTARTLGTDQDILLATTGAVSASSITASGDLSIGNSVDAASSITADFLTAESGSITATAGSMTLGSATAGLSIALRSDGAISFDGAATAGNSQPSGNVTVQGITGSRAAMFEAGTVNAKTGLVSVQADAIAIGTLRSDTGSTLLATGTVALGAASVGGNLTVQTDGRITLGETGVQSIAADGQLTITSNADAIVRGAASTGLAIRSNAADAGTGALAITAQNAVALGNASLSGGTAGTAAVTVRSTSADVTIGSASGTRFTGTAATTFTAGGAITADSATAATGNTISITGLTGVSLTSARTGGTGENIVLTSNGPVTATTLDARKNLTVASLANPAASLSANTLSAREGAINAFAGSIALGNSGTAGSASAGQSVTLRSDGAISVAGAVTAGTSQPSGSVNVSGLTGVRAASFEAGTVNAVTGLVNVKADTQTIASVRSDTTSTLDATGAVTLGSASVGTDLTVTSANGPITLGTQGVQSMVAGGKIAITATNGAIGRGAASTGLAIRSNDADSAAGNTLAIRGAGAVDLGNASVFGGTTGTSAVSVISNNANVVIGTARGTSFTGTAATTFTAGGAITADSATAATGNTISITGLTGISLTSARTGGTGENIVLTSNGPVTATTLDARKNLTVASLANPAASLSANTLSAREGAINVFAGSIALGNSGTAGSASAGQSVTLRSDGAISVAGAVTAGTDLTVAGLATTNAASFEATRAEAGLGIVDVKAGIVDIGTTEAGQDVLVAGTRVALGRITAGTEAGNGRILVTSSGDVTLGKSVGQAIAARGAIDITSSSGSISQGAAGITLTSNSDGAGAGNLSLRAGGNLALADATLNGGANQQSAVSLVSTGDTAIKAASSAAFTATAGRNFTSTGSVQAAGSATITAGANADVALVTTTGAGNGLSVSAASVDIGQVTSAGDYTVAATGAITLGKRVAQVQAAAGAVSIRSSGGGISQGATGLVLTANSDGIGAEAASLDAATGIALAGATLNGGSAKQSEVTMASGTDTHIGLVNAAAFTATAGGLFDGAALSVGTGATTVTAGTTATVGTVQAGGNYTVSAAGDITLGKAVNQTQAAAGAVSVTSTSGSIAQGATGLTLTSNSDGTGTEALALRAGKAIALSGATLNGGAARQSAVTMASGTDTHVGSVNGAAFTATAGGLFDGAALSVGTGATTVTAGTTAAIGSVQAGGNYTVSAAGDITLGKAANQTQAAVGAVSVTSTSGSIAQGATGLTLTSNSDGTGAEALTLRAGSAIALGGAGLNGGSAKQSAVSLSSGTDTEVGAINAASVTAAAGRDFTANRAITATGNVGITASRKITLGSSVTSGNAVVLSGSDATIGGEIIAKTIDVTNSGSGALVIGGDSEAASGKFVLNALEASRLKASDTLTLGADASDDVELKAVTFTVPKTVRVLAAGKRIDVTGRVAFDSDTVLKLGSSGTTDAQRTSIIQLSSTKGGMIVADDGVLELSAANIVAGADDFASDLGALSGSSTAKGDYDRALAMNLNPGSKLYNPTVSNNAVLIKVGAMKIAFTGFAMFQNTGTSLLASGVSLGGGNATSIALDISSPSSQPVFSAFGSINGVFNANTALLGNPPLAHYDNVSASRLNGCVIGGGNCQSVQNLTPSLTALDNVRATIFTVKPDFQVPFDPLIGTNNDALFDDVGSFGLSDIPMTPIECSDPKGNCDAQKKDGN